jgi:hypothetical protein
VRSVCQSRKVLQRGFRHELISLQKLDRLATIARLLQEIAPSEALMWPLRQLILLAFLLLR